MKVFRTLLICGVLVGGSYGAWHYTRPAKQTAAAPTAVPVTAAVSHEITIPIYIPTIGNVRALNSIEIHPQVTGVLLDVSVKEGDDVKKGQVLAVIDPRPFKAALDKSQAQLVQDQSQLQNAQSDQKRYSALAQRDFASRQQVDTQNSTVGRLQGVIAADNASIEEAQISLGFSILRSPIDGRIGLRRVDPGNLVQANGSGPGIFSVVQERPISVIFSLPESNLPTVRNAMKLGKLNTYADAPGSDRVLGTGTLSTTDNAVNSDSGTIQMRADFPNPDLMLTAGQFVNVRLQVGTATGIGIPHLALQTGQDGLFVFEIDTSKHVKQQPVKITYDNGSEAVLASGLAAGAMVVTGGQSRVGGGTLVSYKEGNTPDDTTPSNQSASK